MDPEACSWWHKTCYVRVADGNKKQDRKKSMATTDHQLTTIPTSGAEVKNIHHVKEMLGYGCCNGSFPYILLFLSLIS